MLRDRGQSQEVPYCIISFIWKDQNTQVHRDRKQVSDCQELGQGNQERLFEGYRVSFWGVTFSEIFLELVVMAVQRRDCASWYWIAHFKLVKTVHFMLVKSFVYRETQNVGHPCLSHKSKSACPSRKHLSRKPSLHQSQSFNSALASLP